MVPSKRMLDAGLVKESDKRVDPEMDDERRIYYQITGLVRGSRRGARPLSAYRHASAAAKTVSENVCI